MTEFYVKVKPESSEQSVNTSSSITEVGLKQPAENGKANSELIRLIQDILGEKPGIISGHKSRRKKLKVNLSESKVKQRLQDYGEDSTEKQ